MSGLEVVGTISTIIQIIDFTCRVVSRVNQFQSNANGIPKVFKQFSQEIPLLRETFRQIKDIIDHNNLPDETTLSLLPLLAGCEEKLQRLNDIFKRLLPLEDDSWSEKARKSIISLQKDSKTQRLMASIREYVGTLTFHFAVSKGSRLSLADEKLEAIRRWLCAPDPSENYHKALKQQQPGTGEWFLDSKEFSNWKSEPASFLWLYGIPGCGKTILSSTVIDHVIEYCQADVGKVVAYFYFSFMDTKKQDPELMVCSLISQLAQECIKLPTALENLYSYCGKGGSKPSLDSALDVLHEIILSFPQTYIILDALDECTARDELLDILQRIADWKIEKLHLLVTSRKERDIEASLQFIKKREMISLSSSLVDPDINAYVRERLSSDKRLAKWRKDGAIQEEIATTLAKGAHGMFRWAACQLDSLARCLNVSGLRKTLSTLPATLDDTYFRILCAIPDDYVPYAVRILHWLAFAKYQPSLEELAEAAAIDPERNPAYSPDDVLNDPMEVLNIFSSLVCVFENDGKRKVVVLAHYSVQEYLISQRCSMGKAAQFRMEFALSHAYLAKCCIGYLHQFREPGSVTVESRKTYSLATYTSRCWSFHVFVLQGKYEDVTRLAAEFLSPEHEPLYQNCELLAWPPEYQYWERDSPLYYAADRGLTDVMEILISQGADVNESGGYQRMPLNIAARRGSITAVKLLLKHGANIDAPGRMCTALGDASVGGYAELVKFLISRGADVNTGGGYFSFALQAAAFYGVTSCVRLLLEHGADANARGGIYGSALAAAACGYWQNNIETMELLLSCGADMQAHGEFPHVLTAAMGLYSDIARHRIVEFLLENGAEYEGHLPDIEFWKSSGKVLKYDATTCDKKWVDWQQIPPPPPPPPPPLPLPWHYR